MKKDTQLALGIGGLLALIGGGIFWKSKQDASTQKPSAKPLPAAQTPTIQAPLSVPVTPGMQLPATFPGIGGAPGTAAPVTIQQLMANGQALVRDAAGNTYLANILPS